VETAEAGFFTFQMPFLSHNVWCQTITDHTKFSSCVSSGVGMRRPMWRCRSLETSALRFILDDYNGWIFIMYIYWLR